MSIYPGQKPRQILLTHAGDFPSEIDGLPQGDWPGWVRDEDTKDYFLHEWGNLPLTQENIFEHLCLMTFQLGLGWRTVLGKRQALADFFCDYSVQEVAQKSDRELDGAVQSPQLIRNIYKLRACRDNARALVQHRINLPYLFEQSFPVPVRVENYRELPRTHVASDRVCAYLREFGLRYIGPIGICSIAQAFGFIGVEGHRPVL